MRWCEGTRWEVERKKGQRGRETQPLIKVDQEEAGSIRVQVNITIKRSERVTSSLVLNPYLIRDVLPCVSGTYVSPSNLVSPQLIYDLS